MTPETFKELLAQYKAGNLTVAQRQLLSDLLHSPDDRAELEKVFAEDFSRPDSGGAADPETLELIYQHIRLGIDEQPRVRKMYTWRRAAIAAAIVGLVTLTGLLWVKSNRSPDKSIAETFYKNDVKPGGNHAVLTLANGAQILLDSAGKGNLAVQGGARVTKLKEGSLSYDAIGKDLSAVYHNTVSTPIGGQYQVTLADGTQVWLNALSTLKFPTSFQGSARTVELTGEAYFEVAANKDQPFHVHVNGMNVEVLGTHFNVNAYTDETSVRTTLLEGAVRLVKGGSHILLAPGEQGQTSEASGFTLIKNADTEQAVAWKNGYFSFEGADVHTIMRQISRWYNVDVQFEAPPADEHFHGKISRNVNVSEVLNVLAASGINFKIEGNKIILK